MSAAVLTKAAKRHPPRSGRVQVQAFTSTASNGVALDTDFPGRYVTVTNLGAGNCWVLFGDSSVAVDSTQSSGPTLGRKLTSGQTEDWELESTDTHFAVDGDANGTLEIVLSSPV